MDLEYEDYLLCKEAGIINDDLYGGMRYRSVFDFKIDKINELMEA